MNTTYQDFIWENPNCSKYAEDPTAQAIFELLSQEEAIEAMKREAEQDKPALGPCALQIEAYATTLDEPSFDIKKGYNRTVVGRMVKTILKASGYYPTKRKALPKELQGQYFSSAYCYTRPASGSATYQGFSQADPNHFKDTTAPIAHAAFELLSQEEAVAVMIREAEQGKPVLGPYTLQYAAIVQGGYNHAI